MLDERPYETLERAVDRTVDHHRHMRLVIGAGVHKLEPLRELEVELDRRALPHTSNRVPERDVDLGPVECAAASCHRIRDSFSLQRTLEDRFSPVPRRIISKLLMRPRGNGEPHLEAEGTTDESIYLLETEEDF